MTEQLTEEINFKKKRVSFSNLISYLEFSTKNDTDESGDKHNGDLKTNTLLKSHAVDINKISGPEIFSNTIETVIEEIDGEKTGIYSNDNSIEEFNKTTIVLDEDNCNSEDDSVEMINKKQNTMYFSNMDMDLTEMNSTIYDKFIKFNNNQDTIGFSNDHITDTHSIMIKKSDEDEKSILHCNNDKLQIHNDCIKNKYDCSAVNLELSIISQNNPNDLNSKNIIHDDNIYNNKENENMLLNNNRLSLGLNLKDVSIYKNTSNYMTNSDSNILISKVNPFVPFRTLRHSNVMPKIYCETEENNHIIQPEKEEMIDTMDLNQILTNKISNQKRNDQQYIYCEKQFEGEEFVTNKEINKQARIKIYDAPQIDCNFNPIYNSTQILDSINIQNLRSENHSMISFKEFELSNEIDAFTNEKGIDSEYIMKNYFTDIKKAKIIPLDETGINKMTDPFSISLINKSVITSDILEPYNTHSETSCLHDEQMKTFEQTDNENIADYFPNLENSENLNMLNNSNILQNLNSNHNSKFNSNDEFNNINKISLLDDDNPINPINEGANIMDVNSINNFVCMDTLNLQKKHCFGIKENKLYNLNLCENSNIKVNDVMCLEANDKAEYDTEINKNKCNIGIMIPIENEYLDNNINKYILNENSVDQYNAFETDQPIKDRFDWITLDKQEFGNCRSFAKYKMAIFDKIKHSSIYVPKYRLTWNCYIKLFLSVNDFLLNSLIIYKKRFEEFFPINSKDYNDRISNLQKASTISDNIMAINESSKINLPSCDVDLRSSEYIDSLKTRDVLIQLHIDLWHLLNDLFEWNLQYVNEKGLRISIGFRNNTINIIMKLALPDLFVLQPLKIINFKIKIDNQNLIKGIDEYFQIKILDNLTENWFKESANNLPMMVNDITRLVVTCRNFKNSITNQQYRSTNPNGRLLFFTHSNGILTLVLWDDDCVDITMTTNLQLTCTSKWFLKCKIRNPNNYKKCQDITDAINNLTFCPLNYIQNVFNCFCT